MYFAPVNGRRVMLQGVRCEIAVQGNKNSSTAITTAAEGNAQRITRIVIAGEKVAHVFEPSDHPIDVDAELNYRAVPSRHGAADPQ